MNFYIASHDQALGRQLRVGLTAAGHVSTASWLDLPFGKTEGVNLSTRAMIAAKDCADIASSDAIVLIAGPDKYSGGKFVEVGYALGLGMPVFILGRRENMLLWHPRTVARDDLDSLLAAIREHFCVPIQHYE